MIAARRGGLAWALAAGLLLGLAIVLAVVNGTSWWAAGRDGVLPREQLTVESQVLDSDGIALEVRAGAALPVRIAQVQVDGAFWDFAQEPLGTLPAGTGGWLRIPYPWVYGEGHLISIVSSTGAVFEHYIGRAAPTPTRAAPTWLALLGLVVGAGPLLLVLVGRPVGRFWNPALANGALALGLVGLLVLLAGTVQLAFECATETRARLSAEAGAGFVLLLTAATATLLLAAAGLVRDWDGSAWRRVRGLAQVMGLRNACAGLAIGAAFAIQATALAGWLAFGMALHNGLTGRRWLVHLELPRLAWRRLVRLTAMVALPTAVAIWLGTHAVYPGWAAVALAIGAGALLRVTAGLGWYLACRTRLVLGIDARGEET